MLIETTEDFKRVRGTILNEGIQMITPQAGTKIKALAYKDEMLLFQFETAYTEEIILNLKTGVKYWLSTAAEILMKTEILNILDTHPTPRGRAELLCAAEKLSARELEDVLDEAEIVLLEKQNREKSQLKETMSTDLRKEYDRLVSDLETGSYTYVSDANTTPTATYNWANAMEETRNL